MRILFLSENFPPEVNAPATRTYEHCKEWVKMGLDVTVITCAPNFPQGKVYDAYKNKIVQTEWINNIKVIRVWSFISPNKGFAKRILDFASYAIMALGAGLFVSADIIIATTPQFFTAISGRLLSFVKRKPWVMEVRDLWPESIKSVGAMKGNELSYKFLEYLELKLYQSAHRIVVVTDAFKDKIINLGINGEKISTVKNGVLLETFRPQPKDTEIIKDLGLEGKFIVGYIGTHGLAHALDFVIATAKKIEDHRIHILLIGDGAEKESLIKLKERLQVQNVSFLPLQPKELISKYISVLDVALVNLKKSDTFKTVIPSKIFENAAMGKPILLGVEGESKDLVESYQAGLCFVPEDEKSFLESLTRLVRDDIYYRECAENCKKLAKDFDRLEKAKELVQVIKQIVRN